MIARAAGLVALLTCVWCSATPILAAGKETPRSLYVGEETSRVHGQNGSKLTLIADHTYTEVWKVRRENETFKAEYWIEPTSRLRIGHFTPDPNQPLVKGSKTFNLYSGLVNPFGKAKTGFVPEWPLLGTELFVIPSKPPAGNDAGSQTGMKAFQTPEWFTPAFDGVWAYRWKEEGAGRYTVRSQVSAKSQVSAESDDQHFVIAGQHQTELRWPDIEMLRMSGETLVTIEPATMIHGEGPTSAEAKEHVAQFERLACHYTFRIVSDGTDEAKQIRLTPRLEERLLAWRAELK